MGAINQFNLDRIIRDYNIRYFFETGTWKGDAVAHALLFPFEKIISAEIIPAIAAKAKLRFQQEARVTLLKQAAQTALSANCLL